jgi:hypothetical protein
LYGIAGRPVKRRSAWRVGERMAGETEEARAKLTAAWRAVGNRLLIRPPADLNPDSRVRPPVPDPGTTRVIPPAGEPGGNQALQPK